MAVLGGQALSCERGSPVQLGRQQGLQRLEIISVRTSGGMLGARWGEKAVSRERISDSRYGSRSSW